MNAVRKALLREREQLMFRGGSPDEVRRLQQDIATLVCADIVLQRYAGRTRTNPRRGALDEQSTLWLTREILTKNGGPLHVDIIIERLKSEHDRTVKKTVLTSQLTKFVKRKEIFAQVGRGTYDLLERPIPRAAVVEDRVDPAELRRAREELERRNRET